MERRIHAVIFDISYIPYNPNRFVQGSENYPVELEKTGAFQPEPLGNFPLQPEKTPGLSGSGSPVEPENRVPI